MNTVRDWIKASRLPAQMNIFIPLLLGQVYGAVYTKQWSWLTFLGISLYGLFMQLYIVYGNDYADREADALNMDYTIFSGGSRVLVDKVIKPEHLLKASKITAIAAIVVLIPYMFKAPLILALALLGHLLFWLYSFPPAKLNYRGGGEFLQAIGVGVILPAIGLLSYAPNHLKYFLPICFMTLLPNAFASALTSTVPDENADRSAGKHTLAVKLQGITIRFIIPLLYTIIIYLLVSKALISPAFKLLFIIPVLPLFILAKWARPGTFKVKLFTLLSLSTTLYIQLLLIIGISGLYFAFNGH